MERSPLPLDLAAPFTVAQARAAGVSMSRLRARDLATPFSGVRIPAAELTVDARRLLALQAVLPTSAAFSHSTAALLWRLPLPAPLQTYDPVHIGLPANGPRVRRSGVLEHHGDREVVVQRDLRLTALADTWCDLATQLDVTELVQAGDAILNRQGWDLPRLRHAVQRHPGRRGRATLRAALLLVRPRSGSPRETLARLLFAEWGLPEPELNVEIHNASGWLATVDFLWRDRGVVGEYYGSVHGASWKADLARVAMLEDLGLRVVVITDDDVRRRRPQLCARLQQLLAR